jgi:hypothetical protein
MNISTELLQNIKKNGLESLGIYYGVYAGIVEDNNDPNNLFRLRVKVPSILGNEVSDWAKPRGVFGGKNYGIFAMPEKNDNVWVSFENGDTRFPIWEYGAIAKNEKPKEAKQKALVFISKNGNKIILDENGKIEISNNTHNLNDILNDLFDWLKSAQIITPTGNGVFSPSNLLELNIIQQKINNLLK